MRFHSSDAETKSVSKFFMVFVLCIAPAWQTNAAWYQASGQAVITDGDKVTAKQQATKEAIKQALLFAGASVTSVQQLTNGLLKDDHLEIRASGEVSQLELIDEIYHDDFVTVSIRADVFPQTVQCEASSYLKSVVTTHMSFATSSQTQDGEIFALSEAAPKRLASMFNEHAMHLVVQPIVPERFNWESSTVQAQAYKLAQQTDSQYVLTITATDVSVKRPNRSWSFWKDTTPQREFAVHVRVFDGMDSSIVLDTHYSTVAPWPYDKFTSVDVFSNSFWESQYGKAISQVFSNMLAELDETLSCEQSIGRVLQVANNQLQISLGKVNAVSAGDKLTIYQTRQLVDAFGQSYQQHILHPTTVQVQQVFSNTATVAAVDGSLLSDIQPNDFVVKR
ncbi:flagella assembly protein FlgT [Alteromonas facilis]|uniref:flagella assembly protein FlgT n=1 Tax=Alteromonas facilis TaxID=2048004 RepID=UPI0013DD487B|nr:flagella assembly protein FlgT [Alteromonas facilis]